MRPSFPAKPFASLSRFLPALVVLCGVALRLRQFLFCRSLWLDELFLAVSLPAASPAALLSEPLAYGHVLPPGFALLVRALAASLGGGELAWRLLPFLFGCAALPAAYLAARSWLPRPASLVALALLAFSQTAIFYSNELKPYSADLFFAAALLAAAGRAFSSPPPSRPFAALALLGLLAPWFSHPSLFVLLPVAAVGFLKPRPLRPRLAWLALGLLWGAGILALFLVQYGGMRPSASLPTREWVEHFYVIDQAFMPASLPEALPWLRDTFFRMFAWPGSLGLGASLGAVLFFVGAARLALDRRPEAVLFLAPFLLCILASRFRLYAFDTLHMIASRGSLFLLPGLCLAIAAGWNSLLFRSASGSPSPRLSPAIKALLLAWLFAYPLHQSLHHLRHPFRLEETASLLADLQKEFQTGDSLYAYLWTEPAFEFYGPRFGFDPSAFRLLSPVPAAPLLKDIAHARLQRREIPAPPASVQFAWGCSELFAECQNELLALRGRGRAWFVFAHVDSPQKSAFLDFLDRSATRLRSIERPGAAAYLYLL